MLTDLATSPLAETLRRLSAERRSGDLHVRSHKITKTLFFDHGRIVFAASNLKKDRLGESLVAIGRITPDDFIRAEELMKAGPRSRRMGDALVQAGVLEKGEVGRSVSRQVRQIVLSLFELDEGVASFEERPTPIPLEYMVSLSIHRLLYDGIRRMNNEGLIQAGVGDLDRWVRLTSAPPFPFSPKQALVEEREILEQAQKRVTLRRLAWLPGGITLPRLRAVYALLVAGFLEEEDGASERSPALVMQMETGMFLLSALQQRSDPALIDAIRMEVEQETALSAHLDRERWLQVSRSAPQTEIVQALQEKIEHYHQLRDAVGNDEALRMEIDVVLSRAASMLRLASQDHAARPVSPPPILPASPSAPAVKAPSEAAAGTSNFAGSAQIDHLVMEGHIRMSVSDYANAVKVYEKLVDLAPHVGSFRASLALAMACYPPMSKHAEREFLEAVRIEPNNAEYHFRFGLYYKAMKQRVRAQAELRTAVTLNRRHVQAREELEAISPKDSALVGLKKLFK